jgi:hypothetical protein
VAINFNSSSNHCELHPGLCLKEAVTKRVGVCVVKDSVERLGRCVLAAALETESKAMVVAEPKPRDLPIR